MMSASTRRLQHTSTGYFLLLLLTLLSQPSSFASRQSLGLSLLGFLCVTTSCLGRIWCSVFIAGRKDQELVTEGPYALCRHPLYTLSLLGGLGIALATLSLSLGVGLLGGLGWLLHQAALREERGLLAQFGETYASYRQRTPAFWPHSWRPVTLPPVLVVHPPILWKAFVDAGAFFLLFACVVLARQLSLQYPPITQWGLW